MQPEIQSVAAAMGISPTAVSKRIVFVKKSALDDEWHIGDLIGLVESDTQPDAPPFVMTLHGNFFPMFVKADSLSSMSLQSPRAIKMCERCVFEFRNALDLIQADERTQFVEFETMFENSQAPPS